jgi:hypothetical protein
MRPIVLGSGAGKGAEAKKVPFVNKIAGLPNWSVVGTKLSCQDPSVGKVRLNT